MKEKLLNLANKIGNTKTILASNIMSKYNHILIIVYILLISSCTINKKLSTNICFNTVIPKTEEEQMKDIIIDDIENFEKYEYLIGENEWASGSDGLVKLHKNNTPSRRVVFVLIFILIMNVNFLL